MKKLEFFEHQKSLLGPAFDSSGPQMSMIVRWGLFTFLFFLLSIKSRPFSTSVSIFGLDNFENFLIRASAFFFFLTWLTVFFNFNGLSNFISQFTLPPFWNFVLGERLFSLKISNFFGSFPSHYLHFHVV